VRSKFRGSHLFRHYAASRTMPRVGVRAAIHGHFKQRRRGIVMLVLGTLGE
jgi:hypothetical protein